jgi:hypothetical protein
MCVTAAPLIAPPLTKASVQPVFGLPLTFFTIGFLRRCALTGLRLTVLLRFEAFRFFAGFLRFDVFLAIATPNLQVES